MPATVSRRPTRSPPSAAPNDRGGRSDLVSRVAAYLRPLLATFLMPAAADNAGPAIASMLIYIIMATVLFFRPQGLFPPRLR